MALQVGEVIEKHNEQYEQIEFLQLSHKSHDRFLIIDDNIYLMGASLKDMGTSLCAITRLEMSAEIILNLLKESMQKSSIINEINEPISKDLETNFYLKIYPKGPENGRTVQMNCESVGSDFQAIWQKILKRQVYANFGQSSVTKTLPSPLKARIGKSGNE